MAFASRSRLPLHLIYRDMTPVRVAIMPKTMPTIALASRLVPWGEGKLLLACVVSSVGDVGAVHMPLLIEPMEEPGFEIENE